MYIRQITTYRNMKRTIRLRESELRHMISECVKRVLRESTETIVFGLPLSIILDNNDSITIQYDGNEYTIKKHGDFDATTRYIYLGDKYYEDIGFVVNDGYAICNGNYLTSKMVDINSKHFGDLTDQDNSKDDVIEAYFPKLRQILTNEKLLEQTLYYFAEQNEIFFDEDNILKAFLESSWSKDVAMFFEGLFFGGGNIQWKINGKDV